MIEQYKNNGNNLFKNETISKMTRLAIIAALSGVIFAGASGCTTKAESMDPFTEHDPTIESVTLSPGANIRSEPNIPGEYDTDNILNTTVSTLTVETPGGTDIRNYDDNGDWISVPVESIKKVIPSFDDKADSDGIAWINEQRASPN